MITQLTSSTFSSFITKNKVTVVDFYADWCGPCKVVGPILEGLSNELTQISFGKVNADDEGELAGQFNISSIPTVLIFKNGAPVNQLVGAMSKDAFKRAFEAVHKS
ncbi:MAG: thioredoxin [Candidatus Roizmanbacteria bacterium]